MVWWLLAILIVVSYFIGNINFGKIIASSKNVDLSKQGSGNLGATNMFRNLGAKLGYLTLFLDASKGVISSLTGYLVFGGVAGGNEAIIALYACGLAAILGHDFPVIYKFKGGKGISTTLGVFLVAMPFQTLLVFVFLFVYVWFFKYVSVASLLLVTAMVVWQNLTLQEPSLTISILTFVIFILAWWCHRGNIQRLLLGTERETNIKRKIFKDKKLQQKLKEKQENREEKAVIKSVSKEIKQDFKTDKKDLKNEFKLDKKQLKNEFKLKKKQKKLKIEIKDENI